MSGIVEGVRYGFERIGGVLRKTMKETVKAVRYEFEKLVRWWKEEQSMSLIFNIFGEREKSARLLKY